MQIDVTKDKQRISARLQGTLEISNVAEGRDRLVQILASGSEISLDFTSLTEIDTAGIQLVVAVRAQAAREGKSCRILHPVPEVLDGFRLLSLDRIFDQSVATT